MKKKNDNNNFSGKNRPGYVMSYVMIFQRKKEKKSWLYVGGFRVVKAKQIKITESENNKTEYQ